MCNIQKLLEEYNKLEEGFLPTYQVLGTIIEEKHGFNLLDENNQKMLMKNYPSLKQMLLDLANNL